MIFLPVSMSFRHVEFSKFLLRHAVFIPAGLILAAILAERTGFDLWVSSFFYDARSAIFPAHESALLELFGHRLGKSLVFVIWFALLLFVFVAPWLKPTGAQRRVWGATLFGMAVGPIGVVLLKGLNNRHCPWDLKVYGGAADLTTDWFVSAAEVGHCFPGGHASAGFSLVALMFAGRFLSNPKLERMGLFATLFAGVLFSFVRIVQGAHFLSHNLWSAAICWCLAALAFGALGIQREKAFLVTVEV